MAARTPTEPRKNPLQERSRRTRDDILVAAARVLAREGLPRFNTNRVAEVAGLSVGSLYQYFPNKEALLFELQRRETRDTLSEVAAILADDGHTVVENIRTAIVHFFQTEADEISLRRGLGEAGIDYHHSGDHRSLEEEAVAALAAFLAMRMPGIDDPAFRARFVLATVSSLAEKITEGEAPPTDLERWAAACADMVLAWLLGSGQAAVGPGEADAGSAAEPTSS
jgi:AcrR family transcriptional regulator